MAWNWIMLAFQGFTRVLFLVPYVDNDLIFNKGSISTKSWMLPASQGSQRFARVLCLVPYLDNQLVFNEEIVST